MEKEIAIFKTDKETINVEVIFEDETVWLTQEQMAKMFEKAKSTINEHIKHIFEEGELDELNATRKFGNTEFSTDVTKPKIYYNLDVIISVGYRVKSLRGTQFRQWATKRLNEYIRKGFALDDSRLKQLGGGEYWSELLARIRDIRASEKLFYRQVLDIYATSIDYNPRSDTSIEFFKKVQNKIHFAVHGKTAAEVIYNRADAEKEFMGLKTFEGDRPHLKDAVVAKNYLDEKELRAMGQIVGGYLDFAERQAERHQIMTMKDWAEHLDRILTMSGEQLLQGNGSVSHDKAVEKATSEYKKYQQKTLSDVEKAFLDSIKQIGNVGKK
ncbi:virulence RhuM family protein [Treponema succinifaciens]|uniref:virulence RhuM family protein n=1 Tax=Treponema succinifaciens TaxID=167 RepID=UPI0023F3860C|nr:virulence RhuM family protein [Treponema succinifaciens]